MLVILAIGYVALSKLSGFSLIACKCEIGLRVGLIRLVYIIIFSDRLVTIVLDKNVSIDLVITTAHSVAL